MQLIAPLAAGFADAPSGTALIYRRGTTTAASTYSDAKGTAVTGTHSLSSSGRIIRYVNEAVDVVVKNSSGTEVASFTVMQAATAVEVRHAGFTGTDYDTGASAFGNPTTLEAILGLAKTSFGEEDFKVAVNGTDTLLKNAIGGVLGMFHNVKDGTYGAAGNGTTDDKAAIQAAIDAADDSGGVVFFPPGTYRITGELTVPGNVSLLGLGPEVSVLATDSATANWLRFTSATTRGFQVVEGLRFRALQTDSGNNVEFDVNTSRVVFRNCFFDGSTGDLIDMEAGVCKTRFEACTFNLSAEDSRSIVVTGTTGTGPCEVTGCTFITPDGAYTPTTAMLVCEAAIVTGCLVDLSATDSGTFTLFDVLAVGGSHYENNEIVAAAGGTITVWALGSLGATAGFFENGNTVPSAYTVYTLGNDPQGPVFLGNRLTRSRHTVISSSGATWSVNPLLYATETMEYTSTIGTAPNVSVAAAADARAPIGAELTLIFDNNNSSAAAATVTVDTTYFRGDFASTANDNVSVTKYVKTSSTINSSMWRRASATTGSAR